MAKYQQLPSSVDHTMQFSVAACLKAAWMTFKRRSGFFMLLTLLVLGLDETASRILDSTQDSPGMVLSYAVTVMVQIVVGFGMTRITLHAVDDVNATSLPDAWQPRYFLSFLMASILFVIMMGLCWILAFALVFPVMVLDVSPNTSVLFGLGLVIPLALAVILAVTFGFYAYPTAEGAGPIQALSYSRLITKGHRWRILLLLLAVFLVNVIGSVLAGVWKSSLDKSGLATLFGTVDGRAGSWVAGTTGIIWLMVSIPVFVLAMAHAYRRLVRIADAKAQMSKPA